MLNLTLSSFKQYPGTAQKSWVSFDVLTFFCESLLQASKFETANGSSRSRQMAQDFSLFSTNRKFFLLKPIT